MIVPKIEHEVFEFQSFYARLLIIQCIFISD
jgi:hypothetical protein